jgi:hypothetical protein
MVLPAALALLAACSSKQTIEVKGDGSGTAAVRFEVKPLFVDYFTSGDHPRVFDPARVKAGIEKRPGFRVTRIATPTPESLEMELAFDDLRTLFAEGIISLTEKDGRTTVALRLDRKSARKLGALFSEVSNPAFREMSPREQRVRTEKEYLEAIEFAVGREGPPLVKSSALELTVMVDGQLVGQTGGRITGQTAVFSVPVLRLLMLEQPLDYSVTFIPAKAKDAKKPRKAG